MKEFKYLIQDKNKSRDISEIATEYYKNELSKKIFIWNSRNTRFYVFDSVEELKNFILSKPQSERTYHEVIFGQRPQKIKFDIDKANPEAFKEIMLAIKKVWKEKYNLNADIFVFTTSPDYSYHVIINLYLPSVKQVLEFYEAVKKVLIYNGNASEQYLDARYSSIQNFRLMYCSKQPYGPIKLPLDKSVKFEESLVSYISSN